MKGNVARILAVALVGPPFVVGLTGVGVPLPVAIAVAATIAAVVVWRSRVALADLHRTLPSIAGRIVFLVALALATFYIVQLSRFMYDETRADLSVLPGREFFRTHSCLSSYTEADRFAVAGSNIYDPAQYAIVPQPGEFKDKFIGPFVIDFYQYPPGFLLLPRVASEAGLDFFATRRVWFAVQAMLLFAAMVGLARWVGGACGAVVLLLVPFVWLAPTTRLTFQVGNFQLTAFAVAILAMLAFERRRSWAGGLALGFVTVGKIFPGALAVPLVAQRRWSALGWTAAWIVALTLLAWLVIGGKPFVDFFHYQLPRIQSGEAFFWIEFPQFAPVNESLYGLITKLRVLGLPGTSHAMGNAVATVYAVLLIPIGFLAGVRLRRIAATMDPGVVRLRQAQVWLALLNLASFRSPFVPDGYGFIGTLWLLTLVAAESRRRWSAWVAFAALGVAFCLILDGGLVPVPVPAWMALGTLAVQVTAIALNVTAAVTPHRRAAVFSPESSAPGVCA